MPDTLQPQPEASVPVGEPIADTFVIPILPPMGGSGAIDTAIDRSNDVVGIFHNRNAEKRLELGRRQATAILRNELTTEQVEANLALIDAHPRKINRVLRGLRKMQGPNTPDPFGVIRHIN